MELTISKKEQTKPACFIQLLKEFEYVEILEIKEDETPISIKHKQLLEQRLKRIELGETTFKSWNLIKKKYEKKAI